MSFHSSVLLVCVCLAAGCSKSGDKLPDLHPVKGTLTQNGKTVSGGTVRFMPADNQDLIVTGDVDASGRFELQTIKNDKKHKGAPAGTYTVTYMPQTADQNVHPIQTTKTFAVEAKANEITIELLERQ